ncbi:MAG: hypothetical protein H7A37_05260 [Chlamydiales bacterium]|nr:hypothetical protein [Chlamydiia bacterium]MCP5507688.1 hypothetical protein [Chlamydiales bacterium]
MTVSLPCRSSNVQDFCDLLTGLSAEAESSLSWRDTVHQWQEKRIAQDLELRVKTITEPWLKQGAAVAKLNTHPSILMYRLRKLFNETVGLKAIPPESKIYAEAKRISSKLQTSNCQDASQISSCIHALRQFHWSVNKQTKAFNGEQQTIYIAPHSKDWIALQRILEKLGTLPETGIEHRSFNSFCDILKKFKAFEELERDGQYNAESVATMTQRCVLDYQEFSRICIPFLIKKIAEAVEDVEIFINRKGETIHRDFFEVYLYLSLAPYLLDFLDDTTLEKLRKIKEFQEHRSTNIWPFKKGSKNEENVTILSIITSTIEKIPYEKLPKLSYKEVKKASERLWLYFGRDLFSLKPFPEENLLAQKKRFHEALNYLRNHEVFIKTLIKSEELESIIINRFPKLDIEVFREDLMQMVFLFTNYSRIEKKAFIHFREVLLKKYNLKELIEYFHPLKFHKNGDLGKLLQILLNKLLKIHLKSKVIYRNAESQPYTLHRPCPQYLFQTTSLSLLDIQLKTEKHKISVLKNDNKPLLELSGIHTIRHVLDQMADQLYCDFNMVNKYFLSYEGIQKRIQFKKSMENLLQPVIEQILGILTTAKEKRISTELAFIRSSVPNRKMSLSEFLDLRSRTLEKYYIYFSIAVAMHANLSEHTQDKTYTVCRFLNDWGLFQYDSSGIAVIADPLIRALHCILKRFQFSEYKLSAYTESLAEFEDRISTVIRSDLPIYRAMRIKKTFTSLLFRWNPAENGPALCLENLSNIQKNTIILDRYLLELLKLLDGSLTPENPLNSELLKALQNAKKEIFQTASDLLGYLSITLDRVIDFLHKCDSVKQQHIRYFPYLNLMPAIIKHKQKFPSSLRTKHFEAIEKKLNSIEEYFENEGYLKVILDSGELNCQVRKMLLLIAVSVCPKLDLRPTFESISFASSILDQLQTAMPTDDFTFFSDEGAKLDHEISKYLNIRLAYPKAIVEKREKTVILSKLAQRGLDAIMIFLKEPTRSIKNYHKCFLLLCAAKSLLGIKDPNLCNKWNAFIEQLRLPPRTELLKKLYHPNTCGKMMYFLLLDTFLSNDPCLEEYKPIVERYQTFNLSKDDVDDPDEWVVPERSPSQTAESPASPSSQGSLRNIPSLISNWLTNNSN